MQTSNSAHTIWKPTESIHYRLNMKHQSLNPKKSQHALMNQIIIHTKFFSQGSPEPITLGKLFLHKRVENLKINKREMKAHCKTPYSLPNDGEANSSDC